MERKHKTLSYFWGNRVVSHGFSFSSHMWLVAVKWGTALQVLEVCPSEPALRTMKWGAKPVLPLAPSTRETSRLGGEGPSCRLCRPHRESMP